MRAVSIARAVLLPKTDGPPTARMSRALGEDMAISAERGRRAFALGDRIMFLEKARSLGVKNGSARGEIVSVKESDRD